MLYTLIGTLYIIKGRFTEGEPVVATDAKYAYYYAIYIIKGRWPEAEELIANSEYNADYWFEVAILEPA